jgi:hypothetical protein
MNVAPVKERAARQDGPNICDLADDTPQTLTRPLQGNTVELADVELWPETVNGAEVLDAIAKKIRGYVVMADAFADAVALWCAHAHCPKAFLCSPRLHARQIVRKELRENDSP